MMALLAGSGLALAQAPEQPRSLLPSGWLPRSLGRSATVAPADTINSMPVVTPAAPGTAGAADPVKPKPGAAAPEQVTVIPPAYADPGACCTAEEPARDRGRFYGGAEYLYWTVRGDPVPPLVTRGTTSTTIGQPGTQVIFGDSKVDDDFRSGGRALAGLWLGENRTLGVEVGGFYLEPHATRFASSSNGTPRLGRPFVLAFLDNNGNPQTSEFSLFLAAPGQAAGSVAVATGTRFWGTEANARFRAAEEQTWHFDLLAGFRYLQLEDDLSIVCFSTNLPAGPSAPSSAGIDSFNTRNQYYSGQLGAETALRRGRLDLDLRGKVALGIMHEDVNVAGSTTFLTPPPQATVLGSLLTQPTNIGHRNRDVFAVAPEFGVSVGYQVTRNLHLQVGYSALFITNGVVRAGNQIDRGVDRGLIGGGTQEAQPSPRFAFHDTDFWAHGLNAGLEWNF
jgi:hypothetical protein